MSRSLICTVGTSLLTNSDRPWAGWRRPQPLPDAPVVDAWLREADPVAAAAETNTLQAVGLADDDLVVLLHSDTVEGRFCSGRLQTYYAARCRQADERQLDALGYHSATFAQRGLKKLVAEAVAVVAGARKAGREPVFCATGGFKAEIAFLNLLGAFLEVEVYYIHEQFREIVRLPRLPLAWDAEFVTRRQDFFDWIDAEPRPSAEVESRLHGYPELRPLVEEGKDGETCLNAAGDLLFKAAKEKLARGPAAVWPASADRTPGQKDGVSATEHHRPRGWERFVQRLCEIDCVRNVRFDAAAATGPAVKLLDAAAGALGARFSDGKEILPLRVETTADGEAQLQLVADYLRNQMKLK